MLSLCGCPPYGESVMVWAEENKILFLVCPPHATGMTWWTAKALLVGGFQPHTSQPPAHFSRLYRAMATKSLGKRAMRLRPMVSHCSWEILIRHLAWDHPSHPARGFRVSARPAGDEVDVGVHDRLACGFAAVHAHVEALDSLIRSANRFRRTRRRSWASWRSWSVMAK